MVVVVVVVVCGRGSRRVVVVVLRCSFLEGGRLAINMSCRIIYEQCVCEGERKA